MPSPEKRLSVLVLTFAPVSSGPRPLKQIHALQDRYDVTTAGVGPAPSGIQDHVELKSGEGSNPWRMVLFAAVLALRLHRLAFWLSTRNQDAWHKLRHRKWDVIVTHDVPTITLALRLKARLGVLIDLHEYAPRQAEHDWKWRVAVAPYFRWLCRTEVPKADAISVVAEGIAKAYKDNYGLDSRVVVNATPYHDLTPHASRSPIRLVHSGVAHPQRRLHTMIEAARDTSTDVTLDLYLVGSGTPYFQRLAKLAQTTDRVAIHEPVPYAELLPALNRYDVGLAVLAPTTFNLAWCLPNKFFDYIQARLGLIVGPSPEMVKYVERYRVGAVSADFDAAALVEVLNGLTPEMVDGWKRNCDRHARALSGEHQATIWRDMVDELAARPRT